MTLVRAEDRRGDSWKQFWDIILEKTQRPILRDVFRGLDDRLARYYPLFHKLFPDPATRPRQQEVLIEFCRKGKVDEALRAFKKIYLEVVHQIIDHLHAQDSQELVEEGGEAAKSR
jgi:DNA-binding FadR family transcriptional regulator